MKVGDTVTVMTPEGPLSPFGPTMGSRRLEIIGIYSLGLYEFDAAYGFLELPTAQRLLARDRPDFIEVRVDDMYAAPGIAKDIVSDSAATYVTQDWAQMNQSLFSALWLEKVAISITIGLIVMVAALNIVASLVLLVMEKSRDIAILKTMGAAAGSITAIFMLQGLIIGAIGTTVGAVAGLAVTSVLDRYQLIRVPDGRLPGGLRPLQGPGRRLRAGRPGRARHLLRRHHLPLPPGSRLDPAQALRYQ